ncbi:glycosyltransferase family 4 protein [Sporomusa sphaeroides]|uniref:glycosyltransferase family 4 protein n=1 Tax=Sporomusa sphaeroides TaxID=47679 RepID=UPI002B9CA772|nr:glycosyltransferase family 4 protein [Sporomusa sphaeroides]HML34136.1 glycosyltransferase family 4 protein [Sporomusa sphaeroides]
MSDKPSILFVVPRLNIGGAESHVITAATGLHRRGYRVLVASWGGSLVQILKREGIPHFLIPVRLNEHIIGTMLAYLIREHNIDIVHANSTAAGFGALHACRKCNVPLVYTAHGVLGKPDLKLNEAKVIICVSNFLRNFLLDQGFEAHKLETVYNGIEVDRFAPDQNMYQDMRRKLGFADKHFVIGLIARIKNGKGKGHNDIFEVLRRNPQTQNWRFMLVGKGKGELSLKYKAFREKLWDRTVFCGHQVNVPLYMQAMDVVVLPSRIETFGLVLAEAQSMAKPVVAYATTGMIEAVEHTKSGLLVPYGNLDELYKAISIYANDRELAQRTGHYGRERVNNLFNAERMLDRLCTIYNRVWNDDNR